MIAYALLIAFLVFLPDLANLVVREVHWFKEDKRVYRTPKRDA